MQKIRFIQTAPVYYAAAIAQSMAQQRSSYLSLKVISDHFDLSTEYFLHDSIVRAAIAILKEAEVLDVVPDDFGPTLYSVRAEALAHWLQEVAPEKYPVFAKANVAGWNWLKSALVKVNETYNELELSGSDFEIELPDEWQPIPIERGDPELNRAIETISDAIDRIEGDNGYAVHAPGEREVVLSNLRTFRELLTTKAQIYWSQVKHLALEPLSTVVARMGDAATGIAASAAKAALADWLKKGFGKLLELLW